MNGFSNSDEILFDLINTTADEWNTLMASNLGYSVDELHNLITSRGLSIAHEKAKVNVDKKFIKKSSELQKKQDKDNVLEYNGSPDDETLHKATLIEKYTVTINGLEEEVNSIALTGKIIVGFDFSDSDLSHSYFCHCVFYNCKFNNSSLENMTMVNCTFTKCEFLSTDFTSSVIGRCRFFESNLERSALDYTNITDCSFVVCILNNISLIQSKILYSGFSDSVFDGSDWKDSDIIQCSFSNSSLTECDFKRATMVDDIFIRVDFSGADFSSVMVTCLTVALTIVPEQFQELFEVNHLLYSPAMFEWEPMPEVVDDDDYEYEEDDYMDDDYEEDNDEQPWK